MNFMGLFKNIPNPTFSISISHPSPPDLLNHSLTITIGYHFQYATYSVSHIFVTEAKIFL